MKYAGKETDNYFNENKTQTSETMRWEAFKTFLRGHIISSTLTKSKERRLKRLGI